MCVGGPSETNVVRPFCSTRLEVPPFPPPLEKSLLSIHVLIVYGNNVLGALSVRRVFTITYCRSRNGRSVSKGMRSQRPMVKLLRRAACKYSSLPSARIKNETKPYGIVSRKYSPASRQYRSDASFMVQECHRFSALSHFCRQRTVRVLHKRRALYFREALSRLFDRNFPKTHTHSFGIW